MIIRDRRQRLCHRMASAKLLLLHVPAQALVLEHGLNSITPVANDDVNAVSRERSRTIDDMRKHRPSGERLQDFG